MSERVLAYVTRIDAIEPIEGADRIVCAKIKGWQAVVKKDEFQVGETVIYCEVDSFLPIEPQYEFLRNSSYRKLVDGTEGFRIRSCQLKKCLSQGLILKNESHLPEGTDVTNLLGITKWEVDVPVALRGLMYGNFPSNLISKTDEERVQNLSINEIANKEYYITMKLDGSSFTAYRKDKHFGVCSRNMELKETEDNKFWQMARKLNIEEIFNSYEDDYAIQGELMGPGIQGNKEKLTDHDVYVFHVKNLTTNTRLSLEEMTEFCRVHNLRMVPVLNTNFSITKEMTRDDILNMAAGPSLHNPIREGIVFRARNEDFSFKAISNQFLLKYDE